MTPEELETAVKAGNIKALVSLLIPLEEADRKKLAKTAASLLSRSRREQREAFNQRVANARSGQSITFDDVVLGERCASIAAFALCSWTDVKRINPQFIALALEPDFVLRLLRARKPDWIDQWVAKLLAERWGNHWPTIRTLIRERLAATPDSADYIRHMIQSLPGDGYHSKTPLAETLRHDPGLLHDELWRIFEVDFGDNIVLRWQVDDGKPYNKNAELISWNRAVCQLAGDEHIDRSRLLTATLTALNRRQHAQNATWFSKLHEALQPSIDERISHQPAYIELLLNATPAIVGFALDALREIAAAKKLDGTRIAANLPNALALRQKGHALAAARLLKLCAAQGATPAQIAATAATGLDHPAVEVQEACLALLENVGIHDAQDAIASRAPNAAASLRTRLDALLGTATTTTPESAPTDSTDLLAEVEKIPAPLRARAGIDALLTLLNSSNPATTIPALLINPLASPRLNPNKPVIPIATLDELIEALSAGIERGGGSQSGTLEEAEQFECLLDGLSRLGTQRPDDFAACTDPLLKRVFHFLQGADLSFAGMSLVGSIQRLVRAWILRESMPLKDARHEITGKPIVPDILHFFGTRSHAISDRLKDGISGPLLATPTHAGGWIDPRVFVERLAYWQQKQITTTRLAIFHKSGPRPWSDIIDFVQGLLRLAPDHRAEALKLAATLTGESGAATRYALGGNEPIGKTAGLWIAAARARDPFADFPELESRFGRIGPDATSAALYSWKVDTSNMALIGEQNLVISVTPKVQPLLEFPSMLLHHIGNETYWGISDILGIRCFAQVWPANPEASFAFGTGVIQANHNRPASAFAPSAPFLDPLFDQDTPFGPMATLALAMAILSKDPATKGTALDLLISATTDGRINGESLGKLFAQLNQTPRFVRLNRLAETLTELARPGPLHAHVTATIVESFLAELLIRSAEIPADIHHLLTPLRECLVSLNSGPHPETRAALEKISTGKSAKLAKALLTLPPPTLPHPVLMQSLQGRLSRAQLWSDRAT